MIIRDNIWFSYWLHYSFSPINFKFEKQVNGYNFKIKMDHFNYHVRKKFTMNRMNSFNKDLEKKLHVIVLHYLIFIF